MPASPTCIVHVLLPSPFIFVTHTLIMVPNQNPHTLCSPPPTLACPYCPRYFHSKGGCTKHIQGKHHVDRSESNLPLPSSPIPSSSQLSSHEFCYEQPGPLSPIPSDSTPPPPSQGQFSATEPDVDMDVDNSEHLQSDRDYIPPEGNAAEWHVPDPPHIKCAYHPKLNGKSSSF